MKKHFDYANRIKSLVSDLVLNNYKGIDLIVFSLAEFFRKEILQAQIETLEESLQHIDSYDRKSGYIHSKHIVSKISQLKEELRSGK